MFGTRSLASCALLLSVTACDFDTSSAPRVELDVVAQPRSIAPFVTANGTTIELHEVRTAIETVEFTTDGEMHASLLDAVYNLAIPTAYAHPGHDAGGEVVGELQGRYVVDWLDTASVLGVATLLEADYSGANFSFARAVASDGLDVDDPIIGHTFAFAGTATRDGRTVDFEAFIDQDDGRGIVGLPLSFEPSSSVDETLALVFAPVDPIEGETIFDGIDLFALDDDGDGNVTLDEQSEAWATLRRNLQVHDHYAVEVMR